MRKFFILLFCIAFTGIFSANSQENNVLITLNDKKVTKDEFERMYQKNRSFSDTSNKSVDEYLDLFINYKLKVFEAVDLGYDTIKSFIDELAGYKNQLAKPYLEDKSIKDSLLKEAYERTKLEVNASHILIRINPGLSPADTLYAWNKIMEIRSRVLKGEPFEEVARATSDDPSAKQNSGNLGWFSAFKMIYPFENAAYQTSVGEISMPVRTRFGYHIIKVNDKRPSRGEIKVAHIMIRVANGSSNKNIQDAYNKSKEYYDQIKQGKDFAELAQKYSEDFNSAQNGGELRWIKSGMLPPAFEDAAFLLKNPGDISEPVLTDFGWHIIKLIDKKPIGPFEELRSELESKIVRDERGKMTEEKAIEKIKKENGFKEYPDNLNAFYEVADSSIYQGNWDYIAITEMNDPLFSLGNNDYSQQNFALYLSRLQPPGKQTNLQTFINNAYLEFRKKEIIAFEENQLEEKYPEFKYLMQEYHDGILLFNLTKDVVWNKAVTDTVGLRKFYSQHKNNYMWDERVDASIYTTENPEILGTLLKYAKKRAKKKYASEEFLNLICPIDSVPCLEIRDDIFEGKENQWIDSTEWKKGTIKEFKDSGKIIVVVINKLVSPRPKELNEALGIITADYQNYLDEEWIKNLRAKYTITVNKDLLNTIK
ncbi:MAG: peptidylprolyl isomerase [Bacteroidales bacterium]|nr:peptidylprolyl isomerase [Bacteroidales bacterium]